MCIFFEICLRGAQIVSVWSQRWHRCGTLGLHSRSLLLCAYPRKPVYERSSRGTSSTDCVFCGASEESTHLFFSCDVILPMWYEIASWLGWDLVSHSLILGHFEAAIGLGSSKKVGLGFLLVWLVVVWDVWNSCNDIIFAGGTPTIDFLVDRVKFSS